MNLVRNDKPCKNCKVLERKREREEREKKRWKEIEKSIYNSEALKPYIDHYIKKMEENQR